MPKEIISEIKFRKTYILVCFTLGMLAVGGGIAMLFGDKFDLDNCVRYCGIESLLNSSPILFKAFGVIVAVLGFAFLGFSFWLALCLPKITLSKGGLSARFLWKNLNLIKWEDIHRFSLLWLNKKNCVLIIHLIKPEKYRMNSAASNLVGIGMENGEIKIVVRGFKIRGQELLNLLNARLEDSRKAEKNDT